LIWITPFNVYIKKRKSSRMRWALKGDKNACKTLVGKSEWKRPIGSCIRMKPKMTALKNLGWSILVNDNAQDVLVLFNTGIKFGFPWGRWWATYWLVERLKSARKDCCFFDPVTFIFYPLVEPCYCSWLSDWTAG
jgi:hypothetical protein